MILFSRDYFGFEQFAGNECVTLRRSMTDMHSTWSNFEEHDCCWGDLLAPWVSHCEIEIPIRQSGGSSARNHSDLV
jgi:hypothetical protein